MDNTFYYCLPVVLYSLDLQLETSEIIIFHMLLTTQFVMNARQKIYRPCRCKLKYMPV